MTTRKFYYVRVNANIPPDIQAKYAVTPQMRQNLGAPVRVHNESPFWIDHLGTPTSAADWFRDDNGDYWHVSLLQGNGSWAETLLARNGGGSNTIVDDLSGPEEDY